MQKQIRMLEYDFSDYYGEEEEQTNQEQSGSVI